MAATVDERLAQAFVELADTLVAGYDLMEFLQTLTDRCVELLEVDAAGLLLADSRGALRLVAASTEQARVVELFQIQNDEGPCLDCYRTGKAVIVSDIRASSGAARWPQFAAAAREMGYAGVHAIPMRLRDQVIGALNLFRATPGAFDADSVHIGQALADVAAISLLHERSMRRSDTLNEQLQTALNSRVIIEQAKGKLAERLGIDVSQAFTVLRDQARNRNQRLSDLARAFVDGTQAITGPAITGPAATARAGHPGTRQPRPGPRPAP